MRVDRQSAALATAIATLHLVGFGILLLLVLPQRFALSGGQIFGLGLGLTAYVLGARHAFDADHIGAIDNVTRKLVGEGRRPAGVGFFFAAGHSTVVVAVSALVALGAHGLSGALADDSSTLQAVTGIWGPAVAGVFLLAIGSVNLAALTRGRGAAPARGPLTRLYARATRAITRPWQMYPVGLLFGLGFDTATEVALLALSGGAAVSGLPLYAVLCLPVLFTAGMTLFDTVNGVLMRRAYAWAFDDPSRRQAYNRAVTAITAFGALPVAVVSLQAAAANATGGSGWGIDLEHAGYVLVAVLGATWLGVLARARRQLRSAP